MTQPCRTQPRSGVGRQVACEARPGHGADFAGCWRASVQSAEHSAGTGVGAGRMRRVAGVWSPIVALLKGMPVPRAFSETLLVFLPINEEPADSERVLPGLAKVRPLGLQNIDMKLLCGALHDKVSARISANAHASQRCFDRGRYLVANVLEMDTAARRLAIRGMGHTLPVMVF